MYQGAQHLPRRVPATDGHDETSARCHRRACFGGDQLGGIFGHGIGVRENLNFHGVISGQGRLIDTLNPGIQFGVELRVGLLDRQTLDERPRETRHDTVVPAESLVAFLP